jgi:anti-sigma-K factor RskA
MNPKDIIESGDLELYVMGLLSAEQMQQIEQWAEQYPEVRQALDQIEADLEQLAQQQAIAPPPSLQTQLENKLFPPQPPLSTSNKETNSPLRPIKSLSIIVLLQTLVIVALAYQLTKTSPPPCPPIPVQEPSKEQKILAQLQAIANDTATQRIALKGQKASPKAAAVALWNPNKHSLYLSTETMPLPPQDKQYQLWAIVDGKPLDLGVLALKEQWHFIQIPQDAKVQAFAITLEPIGGQPQPTMEQMYVMGAS